jgi:hypothetical protein
MVGVIVMENGGTDASMGNAGGGGADSGPTVTLTEM